MPPDPAPNPTLPTPDAPWSRAVGILESGGLILAPIEGTYALLAAANSTSAKSLPDPAWLAPTAEAMATACEDLYRAAARLARRLAPGPLVLTFDRPLHAPAPAGVSAARVTSQPSTGRIAALAEKPLLCAELTDDRARPASTLPEARAAATRLGFRIDDSGAIDEPPTTRQLATRILMGDASNPGGFSLLRAGGYEDRFIRKQLGVSVLFVCTGNTCRSPMAEAIATALTKSPAGSIDMKFGSAGTAASSGGPPSLDAVTAVKNLDIGATLGHHRSRPLSRKLIAEADVIYTMGRSHLHAILDLDPEAEDKVRLLDPEGGDVPDPVGMSAEVYAQTARRIMAMLRQRLKELGT